jgi:hypothetical protein
MKTRIFKVFLISLLAALSIKTYAETVPDSFTQIVSDYIDCHINCNYKKLRTIMNDDAAFKIPRAEAVIVQTKSDMVDQMKSNKGVKQDCQASFQVVAKSTSLAMVRVDFEYGNCTQQNFLVLEKNADKEWKITQVYKIFNDKEPGTTTPKVIANN